MCNFWRINEENIALNVWIISIMFIIAFIISIIQFIIKYIKFKKIAKNNGNLDINIFKYTLSLLKDKYKE